MRKRIALCLLVAGVASYGPSTLGAQAGGAVAGAIPVGSSPGDWLSYGRDNAETRYSPLNQIDNDNVDRLGLAWTFDLGGAQGGVQVTPLVENGVMYLSGARNVVYSIDLRTQQLRWKWDPAHPSGGGTDGGPRIGNNRGVALYDGKVYIGLGDGRLVALDAETGHPVWSRQTFPYGQRQYGITGAPRIANGKVIIGNSGAENHDVRGHATAFDAQTGEFAWRFYTVPGDPSLPFEHPEMEMAAETWAGEWWTYGGGGTPWDSFSYDHEANLLYIGTGNGAPWSHYWRSDGIGDNLFLNSIIAVNPDNGEMAWYYQAIPEENWDYTTTMNMILAEIVIDGRERRVLMTATKAGFFYVIDRLTGELLAADPISDAVDWASGYDMTTGRPIVNPHANYDTIGSWVSPGGTQWGGHNWHPMSYHPNTGLAYFAGQNNANYYRLDMDFEPNFGGYSTGVDTNPPPGAPPAPEYDPVGFLMAWDPVTNQERWSIPYDLPRNGGTLSTADNLLFSLRRDGWIYAHDATTGEKLWEHAIGNDPVAPITYLVDGRQYVSVVTPAAGTGGRVWTFTLDGNAASPAP